MLFSKLISNILRSNILRSNISMYNTHIKYKFSTNSAYVQYDHKNNNDLIEKRQKIYNNAIDNNAIDNNIIQYEYIIKIPNILEASGSMCNECKGKGVIYKKFTISKINEYDICKKCKGTGIL